jgi:hypothetical protein
LSEVKREEEYQSDFQRLSLTKYASKLSDIGKEPSNNIRPKTLGT